MAVTSSTDLPLDFFELGSLFELPIAILEGSMALQDYRKAFRKLLKLCTDGYNKEGGAFFLYIVKI